MAVGFVLKKEKVKEMAHSHNIIDTDTHFSINPVTRAIKNETSRKTTLIQFDHNSERFTFTLPRYEIEGHDMSLCNNVRVHYINVDSENKRQVKGVYEVEDLHIDSEDENKVLCSWLISSNATQYAGGLSFLIRYACIEKDTITYAWNTAVFSEIYVGSGLDSAVGFESQYFDIIQQWKDEVMKTFNDHLAQWKADAKSAVLADVTEWKKEASANVDEKFNKHSTEWNQKLAVERARINQFTKLKEGSTTGDAELMDARVGYDGKTYPTSGSAFRGQAAEIVQNLIDSGIYEEKVLTGTNKQGFYVARNSGELIEVDNSGRGFIKYDVGEYAGKTLLVSTIIDSDVFSTVIFADENNNPIETTPGFTVYHKVLRTVPESARIMYVNYSIADVAENNVSVKAVDVLNIPAELDAIHFDAQRTDEQLKMFIRTGKFPVVLQWVLGWIDYSSGVESTGAYTNRMKTVGFYKPVFNKIYYAIPAGFRFLALRYSFDDSSETYTFVDSTGYINGEKTGEITVNEGDCFRFLFRANPDVDLVGDEYKVLELYCKSDVLATNNKYTIPEYWEDAVAEKEQEIKNIIIDATKADDDVSLFFAIADPHYPGNSGKSTTLMKYLGEKCGVGLTVCLGDLIMDSVKSHEEGLQRIQDGMNHLKNMSDRALLTQGNHDTNVQISDSNGQLLAERIIYDKEWILHTNNKLLNLNRIAFDDLGKAFYYDDDLQKIRFISLDSFEGKRYVSENAILKEISLGTFTDRQLQWFERVLSGVPAGYSIITFSHYGLCKPYVYNANTGEYVSLTMGGIGNSDKITAIINGFVKNGGVYIGHFGGHLHHDFVSKKGGLVSVQLLNDGTDFRSASYFGEGFEFVGDSPAKTIGTTTECAFDVVIVNKSKRHVDLIRVGAGENRSFNY